MIYFLQSPEGGPVKIGFTGDVAHRRQQLEAFYGCPLAVLATIPGGRKEEAEIHSRFADIRLGRTEQFRPSSDLMAFIGRPLLVGANPDACEALVPAGYGTDLEIRTIGIRTTKGWADWLERASKHSRITIAAFLDRAAAEHAKATGFDEPPPERLP